MKGRLGGKELAEAALRVGKVTTAKQTLPILCGIRLKLDGNTLELHGTDLEQSLIMTIPATVEKPGEVVLNAARFAAVCKELAGDEISLEVGENLQAKVKGPGGRFTLPGMPAEDFPSMSELKGQLAAVHVKGASLAMAIKRTVFCASTDTSRYTMNGIHMALAESGAELAATDGHRMATLKLPLEQAVDEPRGVIIPTEAAKQLQALVETADEVVLAISAAEIGATAGATRFSARLIEGAFPNTQQIAGVILTHPHHIRVETKALQDALRRAVIMSDERAHPVKLAFQGNNALTVSASGPDAGDAEIAVSVSRTTPGGEDITIGFNAKYLLDWLAIAPAQVELRLKDGSSPMSMLADGAPNYVVMPMRLS